MLVIDNKEHFKKVYQKVLELDEETDYRYCLFSKFLQILTDVAKFGDQEFEGKSINHLCWDFADLSFTVNCCRKDKETGEEKNWYTLGAIFHSGAGMGDGTFSVELNPPDGPHWSLHS